jgi:hypothetical protein
MSWLFPPMWKAAFSLFFEGSLSQQCQDKYVQTGRQFAPLGSYYNYNSGSVENFTINKERVKSWIIFKSAI